ncbi:SDR family oxidoreductase [Actinomadura mexicana]|uniref:NAD(P)H-binding n=1 Tax=Actinomadura mexicana TaxID=134959 RepID=A0A238UUY4_9ACTN|nr:NAD(P)H-binding protein [Actinomadura mexicana]SNR26070.1 NAD(P)H-binding [Actinomadura mexicana]
MASAILVTGGTGTLGRQVVPRLREAGQDVRVLSRSRREPADGVEYVTGDLSRNEGIDAALDGVETVMHLAGGSKGDDVVARNMVRAASRAGVRHLVLISVIGADSVPVARLRTRIPGEAGRAYRAGDNLSIEGTDRGVRTREDFQADRLGRPAPVQAAAGRTPRRDSSRGVSPLSPQARAGQRTSVSTCLRSTFPVALRGRGSVVRCQRDGTLK